MFLALRGIKRREWKSKRCSSTQEKVGNTHPLDGDHLAVQLGAVQVLDALRTFLHGSHGDEAVAAGARGAGIGHDLGGHHLSRGTQT